MRNDDGKAVPVRPPVCKTHGEPMRFIKAGKSKAGKDYGAFWGCINRECKVTADHADWMAQLLNEKEPKEPVDFDADLPNE